jgi:type IV secretion system protein VirB1
MSPSALLAVAVACAPQVDTRTTAAIVRAESAFNPWAIGVVEGALVRQPRNREEAVTTAKTLLAEGHSFSVGLGQINVSNFKRLGLTLESAFDPCTNLAALQAVLIECFERASSVERGELARQRALRRALSCYYSGRVHGELRHAYVRTVVTASQQSFR